jgi:hypothetical protein
MLATPGTNEKARLQGGFTHTLHPSYAQAGNKNPRMSGAGGAGNIFGEGALTLC